jgi:hypothetical protein
MRFRGWYVQHRRSSRLDRGGASWPLGRVQLGESEIVADSPVFLGLYAVRIPVEEVVRATVERDLRGGHVRLELTSKHAGDVTIGTLSDKYLRIVELLRERGIHVNERNR